MHNMIRIKDIQNKLLPMIGWEQSYDTTDLSISEYLTKSESGLYYQQAHPLLTLQNIASIAPDFKNANYVVYSSSETYKKGNIVSHNSSLYRAELDSKGKQPDTELTYWTPTNPFSEWLESKTKASIQKVIFRFCNEKIAEGTHKVLCENKTLFDSTARIADLIKNKNNLVGFEIVPIRAKGVVTKINKIGLQFTEPGCYTLYLMHSSSAAPIRVIELVRTKSNSMEWFAFDDLFLPYESDNIDAGGSWYLCYNQNELPGNAKAIRKDKDWSKEPCSACSRRDSIAWQAWSKYLEIHPFCVNNEVIYAEDEGLSMWDIDKNQYTYDTNYGINLEVTVLCDMTDLIVEQRHMFQDIIMKQVAIDMLREFVYNANVRTNRHSINASKLDILYELDGDSTSMKKSGLCYQLDIALKAVKIDTSGISRICLPCKNNGLKFRTI